MTDTNQKLREAFEARMTDNGKWPNAITKGRNGCYLLAQTENAWSEWKACAELIATSAQQDWAEATGLEVINCPNCGDLARSANPRQALALPTAAPEMPLSMNQFGRLVELTREHLTDNTFVYKATSTTGDTCHFGVESAAKAWAKGGTVEPIKVREFKLHTSGPTSDHLPDTWKMIQTAAQVDDINVAESFTSVTKTAPPVGEREAFESYYWGDEPVNYSNPYRPESPEWIAYDACQARAALRAGDAVDAQRWKTSELISRAALTHPDKRTEQMNIAFNAYRKAMESGQSYAACVDAAIDAAMRKGQL